MAATYTEADLAAVTAAKLALAQGKRLVKVTIGNDSTEYGTAQLGELTRLQQEIRADLGSATSFVLTSTGKGL